MKKNITIVVLSLAMVLASPSIAIASTSQTGSTVSVTESKKSSNVYMKLPTYNGKSVVMIENNKNDESTPINLYTVKNGDLVKTGKKVNPFGKTRAIFWKADSVNVNGKTVWQIGKNLYLNSSRVTEIDANNKLNTVRDFGNYPTDKTFNNVDTVTVNNNDSDSVPVMSVQKDGSFVAINNRALTNNSTWKMDQVKRYNGKVYVRVASNEWVNATDYVVK